MWVPSQSGNDIVGTVRTNWAQCVTRPLQQNLTPPLHIIRLALSLGWKSRSNASCNLSQLFPPAPHWADARLKSNSWLNTFPRLMPYDYVGLDMGHTAALWAWTKLASLLHIFQHLNTQVLLNSECSHFFCSIKSVLSSRLSLPWANDSIERCQVRLSRWLYLSRR